MGTPSCDCVPPEGDDWSGVWPRECDHHRKQREAIEACRAVGIMAEHRVAHDLREALAGRPIEHSGGFFIDGHFIHYRSGEKFLYTDKRIDSAAPKEQDRVISLGDYFVHAGTGRRFSCSGIVRRAHNFDKETIIELVIDKE